MELFSFRLSIANLLSGQLSLVLAQVELFVGDRQVNVLSSSSIMIPRVNSSESSDPITGMSAGDVRVAFRCPTVPTVVIHCHAYCGGMLF